MKIAIHNPFVGEEAAESELARRMIIAIEKLGHSAIEVSSAEEIFDAKPDFVLCMHPHVPKSWIYPTYGCMWNPPGYFSGARSIELNVASYDGYFCGSDAIQDWVLDLVRFHSKGKSLCLLLPTANSQPYAPSAALAAGHARLVYLGTNWDGARRQELFAKLDATGLIDVYGKSSGWTSLDFAYQGALPFDGKSITECLAKAGIGLCLHTASHHEAAVPTMRIFEICDAGALAVSDRHPFVVQHFGDSVLYIEDGPAEAMADQIVGHVKWAAANPQLALEMTRRAHAVAEQFCLEVLLGRVIEAHEQRRSKLPPALKPRSDRKDVQIVIRTGARQPAYLSRALASVADQTYRPTNVVLVAYDNVDKVRETASCFGSRLGISVIESKLTGYRSTQLFDGLRAVDAEFFGVLDDDDILYPNHVEVLVGMLSKAGAPKLAYSGANKFTERGNPQHPALSDVSVAYFRDFDRAVLQRYENYIVSNAYIARSELLDHIPLVDPRLDVLEDFYLLLQVLKHTDFEFSWQVTCAFFLRDRANDNVTLAGEERWVTAMARLRYLLATDPVAPIGPQAIDENPEVRALRQELAAVRSSRSWKLTAPYRMLGSRVRRFFLNR